MKDKPAVSVIIPAYGVAAYIREAVESVRAQTFRDWELIVVNDGSPDTPDLEAALADLMPDLCYLTQTNQGAAVARNSGLRVARGRWVAFLDGDDTWLPRYLEEQLRFAEEHGFEFAWCDGYLFGETSRAGARLMSRTPSQGPVTAAALLRQEVNVFTSATVTRRAAVEAVGGFDETLRRAQDFDLWVRMALAGTRMGYHTAPLVRYRKRPGSLSGDEVSQNQRAHTVMTLLATKLTERPDLQRIALSQAAHFKARESLECGKAALSIGNLPVAREAFIRAFEVSPSPKRFLLQAGVRLLPGLVSMLYRKRV